MTLYEKTLDTLKLARREVQKSEEIGDYDNANFWGEVAGACLNKIDVMDIRQGSIELDD